MTRINVFTTTEDSWGYTETRLDGWFYLDKATAFQESRYWDGNNMVGTSSGTQWDHQILYRTAQGRWVLHRWSQWQGVQPSYNWITKEQAREWLLINHYDDEVEQFFGPLEEECGPQLLQEAK